MALATTTPFIYPNLPGTHLGSALGSAVNVTLDADTEYVFFHFVAPRTETLDQFEFVVSSVTASGNVEVQICTVDTADGAPLATVGSEATLNVTTTGGKEVTGMNASVTAGTKYGVRVMVAASVNIALQVSWGGSSYFGSTGYVSNVTGSVVRSAISWNGCPIALGTTGGYKNGYSPHWAGCNSGNRASANVNNSFAGNKITFPFAGLLHGLRFEKSAGATAYDLTLLAANAAGSVLASVTFNDTQDFIAGNPMAIGYFTDTHEFAAGDVIYLLVRADTANNTLLYYDTFRTAGSILGSWDTGNCRVTGSSLGSYSEDTDGVAMVFPIISQLSDNVGSGSGGGTFRTVKSGLIG